MTIFPLYIFAKIGYSINKLIYYSFICRDPVFRGHGTEKACSLIEKHLRKDGIA